MAIFPALSICGWLPKEGKGFPFYKSFAGKNLESLELLKKECPEDIALVAGYIDCADKGDADSRSGYERKLAVIYNGRVVHIHGVSSAEAGKINTFEFRGETISFMSFDEILWKTGSPESSCIKKIKIMAESRVSVISPNAELYSTGAVKMRTDLLQPLENMPTYRLFL